MAGFFKQFLTRPQATGGFAPCGKQIVRLATSSVDLENAKVVVELGPGTGVFTEKIMEKIGPDTVFFAIEINPDFVKATRKKCPEATVYEDSAENLPKYLKKHGVEQVDVIVSTLPMTVFPDKVRKNIMRAINEALRPGGEFVTVCYLHGKSLPGGIKLKKILSENFSVVNPTKPVWNKVLPMFAYHCER